MPTVIKTVLQSSLGRTAGIYAGANIINSAVPFLMLPVLTRYLTREDYGIVAMFGALIAVTTPFVGMASQGAVNRQYFEKDEIRFPEYIGNCFVILGCSTLMVFALFWIFSDFIAELTRFPDEWLWSVPLFCVLQYVIRVALTLWRVRMMPVQYGLYQLLLTITNLAVSVWLVVGFGMKWEGRITGQLVSFLVFGLIGFGLLLRGKWVVFKINWKYIRHALGFGIPLLPHELGSWTIGMADRVFVTRMVGLADTGVYTVGYQIGTVIGLIQSSFHLAWVPWLFSELKKDDAAVKLKIVRVTYLYFGVILIIAIALGITAPWFFGYFLGTGFHGSTRFVFWVALGYAFDGMYKMVACYIMYVQKTAILAMMTGLTAIINIIFNYVLISRYGAIGAAQATTISFFVCFVLTWLASSRVYAMPYFLKRKRH